MNNFELRVATWWKRRVPKDDEVRPSSIINVFDFKKEHNHMCSVEILFSNKEVRTLTSRVLYNPKRDTWAIDASLAIIDIKD